MWTSYARAFVFIGLSYFSVKTADADPYHEVPRITSNISCRWTPYPTTYNNENRIQQLNLLPPCSLNTGILAEFGNSQLIFSTTNGYLWIEALDGTGVAWGRTQQWVPWTRIEWQTDGNLVVYDDLYEHRAVWDTKTSGLCKKQGDYKTLTFQQDGNMVIYCWNPQGGFIPLWSTGTWIRE